MKLEVCPLVLSLKQAVQLINQSINYSILLSATIWLIKYEKSNKKHTRKYENLNSSSFGFLRNNLLNKFNLIKLSELRLEFKFIFSTEEPDKTFSNFK